MKQKILAGVCLIGLCFIIFPNDSAMAAPNVKDCIENEDCNDREETPAVTEESEQGDTADSAGAGSLFINLVKLIFALLLVLGLIYVLLKFLNKRTRRFQQVKGLENIGGISVGPNKSVQLVRIGSKVYIVGVGENVELLEEITDEDTKEAILHNDSSGENEPAGGLLAFLQQKLNGKSDNKGSSDFSQLFASELDKLKQTRRSAINRQKQKEDHYE